MGQLITIDFRGVRTDYYIRGALNLTDIEAEGHHRNPDACITAASWADTLVPLTDAELDRLNADDSHNMIIMEHQL